MTKARTTALARSTAAATTAAVDTARTLAFRLPVLFGAPVPAALEWHRAVTEKMLATTSGSMAAGFAFQQLALGVGLGTVKPERIGDELVAIAAKATAPGYAAVAANARRLARASRA